MRRLALIGLAMLSGCNKVSVAPAAKEEALAPVVAATVTVPSDIGPQKWTFHARGNEPFWSVVTTKGQAIYSTPEVQPGQVLKVTTGWGADGVAASIKGKVTQFWIGKLNGQAFRLEIAPGECSDGMSDQSYEFTAKLTIGSEVRSGCAVAD